jgi:hypothetical protein
MSGAPGVSVAVLLPDAYATVAVMADPPSGVSVKVDPVIVEESMASLKVAVTFDVMATPVLAFAGVTELTAGAASATVVKVQV